MLLYSASLPILFLPVPFLALIKRFLYLLVCILTYAAATVLLIGFIIAIVDQVETCRVLFLLIVAYLES